METQVFATGTRRGWAGILLVALGVFAQPALAAGATCNGLKAKADPLNQTVPETTNGSPTPVTLNGTTSTPPGRITRYAWAYRSGPAVTLLNANTATASFAAPAVGSTGGSVTFRLTVTCDNGDQDFVDSTVNVTDVVTNQPPVASATAPTSASEGNTVVLDGSASFDPDPGTTLSYAWTQVGGAPTVALSKSNASGSIVSFVAPDVSNTAGALLSFQLTVSDGSLSGSTTKLVNILWANDPPVARLACPTGGIIDVNEGAPVSLDGTASSDSDGTLSYAWEQEAGLPNLGIGATITPVLAFNAPHLGYQQLGGVTLRLTVTDNNGASSYAECGLFIHDVTAPALSLPADLDVEATSAAGAAVTFSALAQDAVDDASAYSAACTPDSGSTFSLAAAPVQAKSTQVNCSATDSAGNSASGSFNVTVQDTTPPVITVPGSVGVEATSASGAVATFDATTLDVVDGAGTASCSPASGTTFALGETEVTCNATDARNNAAAPATFTVNVMDTTAPTIDAMADVGPLEATSANGAVASYLAPATHDAVDGNGTATCAPASGTTFAIGTSTVTCGATDAHGNIATPVTFSVNVRDTTPPAIDPHANIGPFEAVGPSGVAVSYAAPATHDLVDGDGTASCLPASGTTFAIGTTTVHCEAHDVAGNASGTTFTVEVADTTAPVIAAHGDVGPIEATGPLGALVTYSAPATSDAVDGNGLASCAPVSGSQFAIGSTTVTCDAVDVHGNVSAPTTFQVTVRDTTAPVIAFHADVTATATGASIAVVTYALPTASDLVDGNTAVSCAPASGSSFAVGTTTVNCSSSDSHGNTATSSFKVIVSYAFSGFFRPVDNLPVVNVVKAGSAVPVKFSLGGDQGLAIFAKGFPASAAMTCSSGSVQDAVEETVTAGGSSLSYDPTTGQYIYVWKTDKAWAGGCRQLQVKFADGSVRVANFSFTR